jgi:hypothetical protein
VKAGNPHTRRTSFVALVLLLPLLASCQQSEIDELAAQVRRLESENERLRSTVEDEHDVVTRLTESLDQTTRDLERLGECLNHTAYAAASLATGVRMLRNPDNLFPCCADFSPRGTCANPPDARIMRYMKRQLSLANEYLSEVSQKRFEALCGPGGSDPTDPRCRP